MNILLYAPNFKPQVGGIAESLHCLSIHLEDRGHDLLVLAPEVPGAEAFDRSSPYRVQRLDAGTGNLLGRVGKVTRVLQAGITQHDPEVILCGGSGGAMPILRVLAAFDAIPFVLIAHGTEVQPPTLRSLWASGFRGILREPANSLGLTTADLVMCVSCSTRRIVEKRGVASSRTRVVYWGVDPPDGEMDRRVTEEIKALIPKDRHDRLLLVTVSRLVRRKGIDRALQALGSSEVLQDKVVYLIAGEGPDRSRLEGIVDNVGIGDIVRFVGHVDEPTKDALLDMADVFIMPNRSLPDGDIEGFGLVFLEAAVRRTPSIAGASGGAPEAVADGETGFVVDPEDPAAIAEAINRLAGDEDLLEQMSTAADERARTSFTWEQTAADVEASLSELVGEQTPPRSTDEP